MSNTTRKPHPIYLFVQCDNGDGSAWLPIHNKNKELVAKVIVSEIDWKWLMQHKFYLEKMDTLAPVLENHEYTFIV